MKTPKEKLAFLANFHSVPVSIFTNEGHKTKQFECPKTALKVFLKDYAFEKAGAAMAYKYMAEEAVEKTNIDFNNITDNTIIELWNSFINQQTENNEINLNGKSNPLCYDIFKKGPSNAKGKYKFIKTADVEYEKTILGVLRTLVNTNIACYVKEMIKSSNVKEAHEKLCYIRGVNSKVISLYMRDIAYVCSSNNEEYNVEWSDLLLPIDTWIAQVYKCIFDQNADISNIDRLKSTIQNKINVECKKHQISPIDFNKGAWYFGSKIAKTYHRLQIALDDDSKAKEFIGEAFTLVEKEKSELSKFL